MSTKEECIILNDIRDHQIMTFGGMETGTYYGIMNYTLEYFDDFEHASFAIIKVSDNYTQICKILDELIISNINTYNNYVLYEVVNWDPSYMSYRLLEKLTTRYLTIKIKGDTILIKQYKGLDSNKFKTSYFLNSYRTYTEYCNKLENMSKAELNKEYKFIFGTKYKGLLSKKKRMKQSLRIYKLSILQS